MVCGQTKIKHFYVKNTVDEQVIPGCGAILSHFRSGWRGHLVTYWGFCSQNKCPKMWLSSFDLFDLCHPLDLWPQPIIYPLPPPRPSAASALLDNTPSIWRWRTTHTCTVKQLLSGKELSSISCGSETPFLVFFCFVFCEHLFTFSYQGVHSLLCIMSIKAGLRGQGEGLLREDQSVTFQLQG